MPSVLSTAMILAVQRQATVKQMFCSTTSDCETLFQSDKRLISRQLDVIFVEITPDVRAPLPPLHFVGLQQWLHPLPEVRVEIIWVCSAFTLDSRLALRALGRGTALRALGRGTNVQP